VCAAMHALHGIGVDGVSGRVRVRVWADDRDAIEAPPVRVIITTPDSGGTRQCHCWGVNNGSKHARTSCRYQSTSGERVPGWPYTTGPARTLTQLERKGACLAVVSV
jgi:hypothetical protein